MHPLAKRDPVHKTSQVGAGLVPPACPTGPLQYLIRSSVDAYSLQTSSDATELVGDSPYFRDIAACQRLYKEIYLRRYSLRSAAGLKL
jgi:hypothetical protein